MTDNNPAENFAGTVKPSKVLIVGTGDEPSIEELRGAQVIRRVSGPRGTSGMPLAGLVALASGVLGSGMNVSYLAGVDCVDSADLVPRGFFGDLRFPRQTLLDYEKARDSCTTTRFDKERSEEADRKRECRAIKKAANIEKARKGNYP